MASTKSAVPPEGKMRVDVSELLKQYGCGPVQFSGSDGPSMNGILFLIMLWI